MKSFAGPSECVTVNEECEFRRHDGTFETVLRQANLMSTPPSDPATAEAVHDFRNVLNVISMLSELALLQLPDNSPVLTIVQQMKAACGDASDLCDKLLDKSRDAGKANHQLDISRIVKAVVPLLSAYLPAKSELRLDLMNGAPFPHASPCDVRQVVMNLVKNAAESLGDLPGSVKVKTGVVELDSELRDEDLEPTAPSKTTYAYISVSDTGCGMDAATRSRLFERSFTTKSNGHGLGMASIHRILQDCGGLIEVQSELGFGTEIRVLFPVRSTGS